MEAKQKPSNEINRLFSLNRNTLLGPKSITWLLLKFQRNCYELSILLFPKCLSLNDLNKKQNLWGETLKYAKGPLFNTSFQSILFRLLKLLVLQSTFLNRNCEIPSSPLLIRNGCFPNLNLWRNCNTNHQIKLFTPVSSRVFLFVAV